ncbi:MAG: DUF4389 domain-containing protein, partial [Actinobacteria bacterium]|nr:DUF4389 domain-containing protein [Actinomycetota bacterium]
MNQAINGHEPYLVVDSPYELARWRPLVNWVLYIPHALILSALQSLARVVFFVYWLMLIFTGKLHPGVFGVMVMYERYNARAGGFLVGWSQAYPPFEFSTGAVDNNGYPAVRLNLPAAPESASRSAGLNVLKAIPHYVVLMIFLIGAAVAAVIGWFAVLFTGAWPHGMRDFLVQVNNYQYRIWTYVTMVDNNYPRFG